MVREMFDMTMRPEQRHDIPEVPVKNIRGLRVASKWAGEPSGLVPGVSVSALLEFGVIGRLNFTG